MGVVEKGVVPDVGEEEDTALVNKDSGISNFHELELDPGSSMLTAFKTGDRKCLDQGDEALGEAMAILAKDFVGVSG